MKNLKLIALLMVLPLVGCGPKTDPNPGPGPGPDPDPGKTVKRTELYASFIEIGKAVTGDEDFTFDPEYDTYYNEGGESYYASDILEGQKDTTYKWENAIADFMNEMPSKYVKVMDVCDYTWDDGDKGLQTAYTLGESIYVSVATWEYAGVDETNIYVSYAVMPNEGYTMVDDGEDLPVQDSVKKVTFKHETSFSGSFDQANSRDAFVTWFNGSDDLLENITLSEGNFAQMQNFAEKNEPMDMRFVLGSGKKACDLQFNFKYTITKIELVVQPYCKYDSYNAIWRNDTSSTLAINSTSDTVDLSTTITDRETEETTITRTYTKEDNQKSLKLITELGKRVMVSSMTITYSK